VVRMLSVELPEPPAMADGLAITVPKLGDADTKRLTVPVKPPSGVTVIVLEPELPWTIERLVGLAVMVKSWIKTVTVVVWLRLPLAPVTVTVYVPALSEQLSVALPEAVTEDGLIVHTSPLGLDVLESVTVPVKPLTGVTVMVELADWPGNALVLVGLALIWKSTT
jgi:hypothetical protein